jgi:hypothetical protein
MKREPPRLMPFLSRPDVHLAIAPEFSTHHARGGIVPGKRFGQRHARDIDWLSEQLRLEQSSVSVRPIRSLRIIKSLRPPRRRRRRSGKP